ncbi:MAG: hypothetical protein PHR78_02400, partial [Eubacteriales bacterium]|nr:hypothetical protein [Eubacteriales bacterium]
MSKHKGLVPKRRFKEFVDTDDWEQRKFYEIVHRSTQVSNVCDLPRVEYEDINSGQGTLNKNIN